jgi:hypothetical protein
MNCSAVNFAAGQDGNASGILAAPYGSVRAPGAVDSGAACSGGTASPDKRSADKICATISRGSGSIEITTGFSSAPGSLSASN